MKFIDGVVGFWLSLINLESLLTLDKCKQKQKRKKHAK